MMEPVKKDASTKFERTSEAMPRLAPQPLADPLAPGADQGSAETGHSDVRSVWVPKLDRHTVWSVIEKLKSR
jgi:hypothetical protein